MKNFKNINTFLAFVLVFIVLFTSSAIAIDIAPDRAFVTERTSTTYTEIIPVYNGTYNSYSSFPIQVTVTSNITYDYATGKIAGYSTPSISMSCSAPDRLVSSIAGGPSCSISSDGYKLLVTHISDAYVGYLWGSLGGVNRYEYTYHTLPSRTISLSPQ